MNKFWTFKAKGDTGELTLYGDISSTTWYGDEVTPKQFKQDLDALGDVKSLDIYINSGGGDVFAGQAIHTMLKRHNARKTVYIDGIAASIASVIAMAGDSVVIPANGMIMIHKAWALVAGNADDMRKMADTMDKVDSSIAGVYVDKTGKPMEEVRELMAAETWFTGEEAVAAGFADVLEKEKRIAASMRGKELCINGQAFDLNRYRNAPPITEEDAVKEDPEGSFSTPTNDSGGESRPVADDETGNRIRRRILEAYEKGN